MPPRIGVAAGSSRCFTDLGHAELMYFWALAGGHMGGEGIRLEPQAWENLGETPVFGRLKVSWGKGHTLSVGRRARAF